jgi:type II secretory pathway component PulF
MAWFKKGSGTVAGTAGHRPKVGRVLRTTVPDPFLNNHAQDMHEPYVELLLGILSTLLFGAAVLGASSLLSGPVRSGRESIMDVVLKTIGWTLIWCSILSLSFIIFCGLPLLGIVVLVMVYIRGRRARKYALLSTMGVAAERVMPLPPIIDAYAAEQKGRLARKARLLASRLRSGWLLPDALDASRGLVPREARATIRTGFESGALAAALKHASDDSDSQDAVWAQLGGKLVYLAIVTVLANTLATFMMWKIAPAFEVIFADFDVELPAITQLTLGASHLFVMFGGPFVYLLTPLLWFLVAYSVLRYVGLLEWDLPGMTRLARRLHTARILETLAPLVQRDRPLMGGIGTLARSYPKRFIRRRLKWVLADLEAGMDWCDSMVLRGLMGRADRAVLHAATQVGNLPWAMTEMADSNRRRMAYRCQMWIQVTFALVILAMGIGVLVFCVSFFLPLVSLIRNLV